MTPSYVLVTGATGFIGAHVVDNLLARGLKVRGATRSLSKGQAMLDARPQYAEKLDFVQIRDFGDEGGDLEDAVKGVDGVVHVASPFTYNTTDNLKELILPAIAGVKAILTASSQQPSIRRVILTSSFASVIDIDRNNTTQYYFTYTSADWNPLTFEEAASPASSAVIAYRGSKKFAEQAAWEFMEREKPHFDLITLCPPMTFGPVVHPVDSVELLNESNAMLWQVATGVEPMPVTRVPFWVDVRDLAEAHVQALLRDENGVGGKRFIVASGERFGYGFASEIIRGEFSWAQNVNEMSPEEKQKQKIDESYGLDGTVVERELGISYRSFKTSVTDLVRQAKEMHTSKHA